MYCRIVHALPHSLLLYTRIIHSRDHLDIRIVLLQVVICDDLLKKIQSDPAEPKVQRPNSLLSIRRHYSHPPPVLTRHHLSVHARGPQVLPRMPSHRPRTDDPRSGPSTGHNRRGLQYSPKPCFPCDPEVRRVWRAAWAMGQANCEVLLTESILY